MSQQQHSEPAVDTSDRITVMDIDGVLADVRHRLHFLSTRPKQWDAFFAACAADAPLAQGKAVARQSPALVYFSGRPERYREVTLRWLEAHGFPSAALHLRPDVDRRPAREYKSEVLARLGGPAAVECVYDDDELVVQRLKSLGYQVVQVSWMPSALPADQLALFDAQESQGRT